MIRGCRECSFLAECGGLNGNLDLFGCHRATKKVCRGNGWTCPDCSPGEFLRRKAAVDARTQGGARPTGPTVELPLYIAALQHQHGWTGRLPMRMVAIPTAKVIGRRNQLFGPLFKSASDLRRKFHLAPETEILLVSVSKDDFLERYWRWAKDANTAERLAELGVAAITIPNFSFFSDAPRFHHLYNRGRLEACLNELASAQVPIVPHIHALTSADLAYWLGWLREHVEVRHICREFQTGNNERAIDELADLQSQIGRALHPVIVGGNRFAERLRRLFTRYTIVDSTPFMKAIRRQRAVERDGAIVWEPHPTVSPAEVGATLKHNIERYWRTVEPPSGYQSSMFDVFDKVAAAREAARASKQIVLPLERSRIMRLPILDGAGSLVRGPEDQEL